MQKLTRAWVRKAESDLAAAAKLARQRPPFHDQVCFFCQQGAEKYLKGLLQELGLTVPRTHDLEDVLDLVLPYHATLGSLRRGLQNLTQYAVDFRYPGIHANARKARLAMRHAKAVRQELRTRLGIRSRN